LRKEKKRQLSFKVVAFVLLLLVCNRLLYWYSPTWISLITLGITIVYTAAAAWKDHKTGIFDGATIIYISISVLIFSVFLFYRH